MSGLLTRKILYLYQQYLHHIFKDIHPFRLFSLKTQLDEIKMEYLKRGWGQTDRCREQAREGARARATERMRQSTSVSVRAQAREPEHKPECQSAGDRGRVQERESERG